MTTLLPCCCGACCTEKTIPKYINTTTVPNFNETEGGTIAPYCWPKYPVAPVEAQLLCGGTDQKPCGPVPLTERPAQTFAIDPEDPTMTLECGWFKNVHARKFWQGRKGFNDPDDRQVIVNAWSDEGDTDGLPLTEDERVIDAGFTCGGYRNAVTAPSGVRYLSQSQSLEIYGDYEFVPGDPESPPTSSSLSFSRSASAAINKNSGVLTQSGYSETVSSIKDGVTVPLYQNDVPWAGYQCGAPGGITQQGSYAALFWVLEANGGRLASRGGYNPCGYSIPARPGVGNSNGVYMPIGWTAGEVAAQFSQTIDASSGTVTNVTTQVATCTITDTSLILNIDTEWVYSDSGTGDEGSAEGHVRLTIALGTPYTAVELYADCKALLAQWDLRNHTLYPWRYGDCAGAPLVGRREIPATPLTNAIDTASFVDSSADYYDGAIIGGPTFAGCSDWFDYDGEHFNTTYEVLDCYGERWGGPPFASHWNNYNETENASYRGAFVRFFPQDHELFAGWLYMGKWAERKVTLPAQNWFRPCGADRYIGSGATYPDAWPICGRIAITAAAQVGGTVELTLAESSVLEAGDVVDFTGVSGLGAGVTVDSASGTLVVVTGTLSGAYTSGGYISSNGAPSHIWNTSEPRGDYLVKEWAFNYRAVGEYNRCLGQYLGCGEDAQSLATVPTAVRIHQESHGMPQEVSSFTVTEGNTTALCPVFVCTPNGDVGSGWISRAWTADIVADSLYGNQWNLQFQQFMADLIEPTDGLGNVNWVEARNTPVSGAPALPDGIVFTCATLADLDSETAPEGKVTCPPPGTGENCVGTPFENPPEA
jgi:hypothetical protein